MSTDAEKEQLQKLLSLRLPQEIIDFLSTLDIADSALNPQGHEFRWVPVGDSLSNAANIETASHSMSPIVERITNGYDAFIELLASQSHEGEATPESPRNAVEKWMGIPSGDMGKFGAKLQQERKKNDRDNLASHCKVEFYASGEERKPTIIIRDDGIGQHPSDFASTLLRLGESNKISFPYLHGTYGHGGSSSFRYCDYTIIISRRHPSALGDKPDLVGWTIVRKNNAVDVYSSKENRVLQIKKPPVYEYLIHTGSSVPSVGYNDFNYGTQIACVAYEAAGWYNLSRGKGYQLFRNFLFNPVLPFRLEDKRPGVDFNRNMFGARSTLLGNKNVAHTNEIEEFISDGGKLKIRYWVLLKQDTKKTEQNDAQDDEETFTKSPLESYLERENSRNTILLTLNGQKHGAMEKSIISKDLRLSNLSNHLLIEIETDHLSRLMKSQLFTSNRESTLQESDAMELIKKTLKDSIEEDEELKDWERKLTIQLSKRADDESRKEVKNMLDRLIRIGIVAGQGGTQKELVDGGTGVTTKYKPQDPPTSLRFTTTQDPIEIIQGKSKRINLEVNAPDDFFTRRKNRGKIYHILTTGNGLSIIYNARELNDGRLPITIVADTDAELSTTRKLKFSIEGDNLLTSLETERDCIITSPPVYVPNEPPTEFAILRNEPIKLHRGAPNSISIALNGDDDILDREQNKAEFTVKVDYPHANLLRIRKPKSGRMQISVFIDKEATIGNTFDIYVTLQLADGTVFNDKKQAIIIEPPKPDEKRGGKTLVTLPNYEIEEVYRQDWEKFSWDATTVGKYGITRDDDGREKLMLYVNADNENIISEIERRVRAGESATATRLRKRYTAYIGYHLYLNFQDNEKPTPKNEEELASSDEEPTTRSEEDQQDEYRRVSKTLVLSLKAITKLAEEDD